MRVNCYNATECSVAEVEVGNTFYLESVLYIKVGVFDVDVVAEYPGRCFIVSLDRGELKSIREDTRVILADTMVVVGNGQK